MMARTPAAAWGPTAHPRPPAGCSHLPGYILFSTGRKPYRVAPVRGKWEETPCPRGYFLLDPGVMGGDVTAGSVLLSHRAPLPPKLGANGRKAKGGLCHG